MFPEQFLITLGQFTGISLLLLRVIVFSDMLSSLRELEQNQEPTRYVSVAGHRGLQEIKADRSGKG